MKPRIIVGLVCLLPLGSCTSPIMVEKQLAAPATPPQVIVIPQAQPIIIRDATADKTIDQAVEQRLHALEQARKPVRVEQTTTEIRYIGCKQEFIPPAISPAPVLSSEAFAKIPRDQHAAIQAALLGQVEKLDQYIKDMKAKYAQAYEAYKKSCKK